MDNVNFDLDDLSKRIGNLVLRIWQLEQEAARQPILNGEAHEVIVEKAKEPVEVK